MCSCIKIAKDFVSPEVSSVVAPLQHSWYLIKLMDTEMMATIHTMFSMKVTID